MVSIYSRLDDPCKIKGSVASPSQLSGKVKQPARSGQTGRARGGSEEIREVPSRPSGFLCVAAG